MLFNVYMDCGTRDVMPTIKSLGISFRYTINGALHEQDSKISGEEDLLWILLYADDIALMSDDPKKLQDIVTALDSAFRRWGLLISVAKTKTLTVHVPMPGEGPVAVPVIFIGTQRGELVDKFKHLGQVIASDGKIKWEVSRRLGPAHAAFTRVDKRGIWTDKAISRRTKLALYKVTIRTILLYCSGRWTTGTADLQRLETTQI
jgi:hypothetical protein